MSKKKVNKSRSLFFKNYGILILALFRAFINIFKKSKPTEKKGEQSSPKTSSSSGSGRSSSGGRSYGGGGSYVPSRAGAKKASGNLNTSLQKLKEAKPEDDLSGLDGSKLSLEDVPLIDLTLNNANFGKASGLKLKKVKMNNSNFSGASFALPMENSELNNCNFTEISIENKSDNKIIENCSFKDSSFSGSSELDSPRDIFKGIRIVDSLFDEATIKRQSLGSTTLVNTRFNGADMEGCDFNDAKTDETSTSSKSDSYWCNVDFSHSKAGKPTNLKNSKWHKVNLKGIDFRSANFEKATLGTDISILSLDDYSTFEDCNFEGAILTNANLKSVKLSNSKLKNTSLSNADFKFANLCGVDLIPVALVKSGYNPLVSDNGL